MIKGESEGRRGKEENEISPPNSNFLKSDARRFLMNTGGSSGITKIFYAFANPEDSLIEKQKKKKEKFFIFGTFMVALA